MAASFSFNFDISEPDNNLLCHENDVEVDLVESTAIGNEAEQVFVDIEQLSEMFARKVVVQCMEIGGLSGEIDRQRLSYLSVGCVESLVQEWFSSSGTNQALKCNTDLVASLYEGGLKIWESSIDLVQFLHTKYAGSGLGGSKVLELGCGAGLPGIYCLTNGAIVHFQDYNGEVLKLFTIPNIISNLLPNKSSNISEKPSDISETLHSTFGETHERSKKSYAVSEKQYEISRKSCDISGNSEISHNISGKLCNGSEKAHQNSKHAPVISEKLLNTIQSTCEFFSGDWSSTSSLVQPSSYDVILTSETIYNPSTQNSLYELIKYSLKPGGVVFIAAKSYYFGVGGGTSQFIDHVRKDGVFCIDTVKTFSDGVKREILEMKYAK